MREGRGGGREGGEKEEGGKREGGGRERGRRGGLEKGLEDRNFFLSTSKAYVSVLGESCKCPQALLVP